MKYGKHIIRKKITIPDKQIASHNISLVGSMLFGDDSIQVMKNYHYLQQFGGRTFASYEW